jgi:hypothetical protein
MSFTMIALVWDMASKEELMCMGFGLQELLVKYPEFKPTEEGVAKGELEMFSLKRQTPSQFAVKLYWEEGKKAVGVVQVAITPRPGTEQTLASMGFKKILAFVKRGAPGPTVEATPKDEQEFLGMSFPPTRWYAGSFWGAGPSDN